MVDIGERVTVQDTRGPYTMNITLERTGDTSFVVIERGITQNRYAILEPSVFFPIHTAAISEEFTLNQPSEIFEEIR